MFYWWQYHKDKIPMAVNESNWAELFDCSCISSLQILRTRTRNFIEPIFLVVYRLVKKNVSHEHVREQFTNMSHDIAHDSLMINTSSWTSHEILPMISCSQIIHLILKKFNALKIKKIKPQKLKISFYFTLINDSNLNQI